MDFSKEDFLKWVSDPARTNDELFTVELFVEQSRVSHDWPHQFVDNGFEAKMQRAKERRADPAIARARSIAGGSSSTEKPPIGSAPTEAMASAMNAELVSVTRPPTISSPMARMQTFMPRSVCVRISLTCASSASPSSPPRAGRG